MRHMGRKLINPNHRWPRRCRWFCFISFRPMCLIHSFAGSFKHQPEEIGRLSTKASDLIKRAFDGINPALLVDYHTHVAGLGTGTNGTFVNPKMRSWRHPFHRAKLKIYLSAGGVADEGREIG